MSQNRTEIVISALNQTQAAFRQLQDSLKGLDKELGMVNRSGSQASSSFASFAGSLRALPGLIAGSAIAMLVKSCIDAGIAAQKMEVQFKAAFGNIIEGAKGLSFIREESERLGLDLQSTAPAFAKFAAASRGTALEGIGVRKVFSGVAEAATAMQLSTDEVNGIFLALSQMMSKGKVSAEELKGQLGERLPGATKLAADALGLTTAQLLDQMQKGKIMSEDLLPKLAEQLHKTYGVSAVEAANSAQGQINKFNNTLFETKSAVGAALIPAMNDILTSLRPVVDMVRDAIKGFQQLAVSYAAGIDKIAAAKEVGWFGLMTESGRARYRRQAAIIQGAAEAQMTEIEKRYAPSTSGVPRPGKTKPSTVVTTGKGGKSKTGKADDLPSAYAMLLKDAKAFAKAWEADQKKLQEDADWISDRRKAYTDAVAKALKDEHELSVASLEHKLTLVDTAAAFRDISRAEAAEQRITLTRQLITEQERWVEVTGKGVEKLDELRAKLREAQAQLLTASDNVTAGGITGMLEYLDELPSLFEGARDTVKGAFQEMEDALVEFVRTGKMNFSSLVDSIISDLARIMVRQNITGPLAAGLGSALSGWFGSGGSGVDVDTWGGLPGGLLGNAKGNAFSGGNVVPFAKGGVVYRPTFFPMAKGMGLMGEAGPEGVLPLARTRGGELGVRTTGASSLTISVPVNVQGNARLASELRNEIEKTVIDVVRRHS